MLRLEAALRAQADHLQRKNTALRMLAQGLIVGSYATSPNLYALEHQDEEGPGGSYDPSREAHFYDGLAALPLCGGLEVQLDQNGSMHCFDEQAFLGSFARPKWKAVITCIGGTMWNVGQNPNFGLASTDEAGRQQAIAFARKALEAVMRWNTRAPGCEGVIAVEIHSGPNGSKGGVGSAEAFAASLQELQTWNWQGAKLIVEHCDAPSGPSPGPYTHPAAKGFLPIDQEIEAIIATGSSVVSGVAVNWARSVLETRDVTTPVAHIEAALNASLLAGLMLSGCTPEEKSTNPYGHWRDCHMPHAPLPDLGSDQYAAKGSLMTADAIQRSIDAALLSPLVYLGCKITSLHTGYWIGDEEDDTLARIGVNSQLLKVIEAALTAILG